MLAKIKWERGSYRETNDIPFFINTENFEMKPVKPEAMGDRLCEKGRNSSRNSVESKEAKEKEGLMKYGEAERKELSKNIYGAIYKVTLDKTHPLAFGLGDSYFSLKTNELHYDFLETGWNVGTIKGKTKPLIGFAGYKINKKLENTLSFGVEDKGKGQIIYFTDDLLFRSFWENGKMLFSNAVFLVGQ